MKALRRLFWLVVLVGGGLATLSWQRSVRGEAAWPAAGSFIEVDGTKLHYLERGSGPPVVLLHGNPGSVEDWRSVIEGLEGDHRVLAFDRPGHGYSERGRDDPGSPLTQAELIAGALKKLGISGAIFVGHSWGGGLSLALALAHPELVRAVVLAEGSVYDDRTSRDPLYVALDLPILGPSLAWTLAGPLGRPKIEGALAKAYAPDAVPEAYLRRSQDLWTRPGEARATAQDNLRRAEVLRALGSRYSEIQAPITILAADQDRLSDPAGQGLALHQALPRTRLVTLPKTGHMVPETRPAAVIEAVRTATHAAVMLEVDATPH
ncbi:MAG: alpha/beta hydrolase [Myxococcota bacterium]